MAPSQKTSAYRYTPLFCEENIWHLAQALVAKGVNPETLQVIVISNPQRQVVLFNQRNGAELGHVVWDYHVILRRHDDETGDRIYDFDSRLPFPCNSRDYLTATFGLQGELDESLRACLRSIPAAKYLHRFYSDRSHMVGVVEKKAFPPWPAITPDHAKVITLAEYWDLQQPLHDGSRVLTVNEFLGTLSGAVSS
ncbi:MAG: protein N-terminal glutamine amidohydrolase [Gammaproteobacteria bacterium]|nr:protein N-terminal glutamine amidohydrolase [Gammaproteobacteria bacterium]